MSQSSTPAAVILNGDTNKHLMASAFLIGEVLKDRTDKNIFVFSYTTDETKTKAADIIKKFGLPVAISGPAKIHKLKDMVRDCVAEAIKKGCHTIYMPNTLTDFNETPAEHSNLITVEAMYACQEAGNKAVEAKAKDKDLSPKELGKIQDQYRIMPAWRFQFMVQEHIENQVKQNTHGLKEFFYPDK